MKDRKKTQVPALDKGMKILEALSRSHEFLTLSQIARSLGYKVSEIQRMVEYLHKAGYIHKNEQKGFYISSNFYALTSRVDIYQLLISKASPLMHQFSLESMESSQLSVLYDRELRLLLNTEGCRNIRIGIHPGTFDPFMTVSGRLMISCLDESEKAKFDITDERKKLLDEYRTFYDSHGYWASESPGFCNLYKLTTLIPVSGMDQSLGFTCTYLLPRGEDFDDFTGTLVKIFLQSRDRLRELF